MTRNLALLPVLATFAAVGSLALMDALMKGAALAAGVYSATLMRAALSAAMAAPIWLGTGGRWPGKRALRLHLLPPPFHRAASSCPLQRLSRSPASRRS